MRNIPSLFLVLTMHKEYEDCMVCASKFEDENYTYIMYHVINSFLLNKKTD